MSKFRVRQLRSGEGAILTHFSTQGFSELPKAFPELVEGRVLIVSGEGLGESGPSGAEKIGEQVWMLQAEDASRFLAESGASGRRALIWALCDDQPSADVLNRCLPDPLRPWDHERIGAAVYAQSGKRYSHEGLWFRDERMRREWIEAAVARLLKAAGMRLPTGDATMVLELPTDSTFEAEFTLSGRGDSLRIKRDFGNQGFTRQWRIERGEWKGEETRRPQGAKAPLMQRITQGVATVGVFVLSLPVALVVFVVLLTTRLTATSSSTSRATTID